MVTPRYAKEVLGLDLSPKEHGAKVKADIAHGESVCNGILVQVRAFFASKGVDVDGRLNHRFSGSRRWELDAAFPEYLVAIELMGHEYHRRREAMDRDYRKQAAAVLMGWRIFYCTAEQAYKHGALWCIEAIEQERARITRGAPQRETLG